VLTSQTAFFFAIWPYFSVVLPREMQLLVIGISDRASHALQTGTPSKIITFVAELLHH
jgi:hypothetical protein